jgi:hypothetical protein
MELSRFWSITLEIVPWRVNLDIREKNVRSENRRPPHELILQATSSPLRRSSRVSRYYTATLHFAPEVLRAETPQFCRVRAALNRVPPNQLTQVGSVRVDFRRG